MSLVGIIGQMKDSAYNSLLLLQSANHNLTACYLGATIHNNGLCQWTVEDTYVGFLEWHVNPIKVFSAMHTRK